MANRGLGFFTLEHRLSNIYGGNGDGGSGDSGGGSDSGGSGSGGSGDGSGIGGSRGISWNDPLIIDSSFFVYIFFLIRTIL